MKERLAPIDGLRGVAILMVTGLHLWMVGSGAQPIRLGLLDLTPFFAFGGAGVSLFFAISGFCLFHPLARATVAGKPWPSWKRFFLRRAVRILPAYWLAVAIWLPIWGTGVGWRDWPWHLVSHLTFTHVLFPGTLNTVTAVLWSLGTEVHFYLFFPLLAVLVRRRPWAVLAVSAAMSIFCQWWGTHRVGPYDFRHDHAPSMVWVSVLPARLFEFASGMVAAWLSATHTPARDRWLPAMWALGLVGLVVAPYIHWAVQPVPTTGRFWWWGDVLFAPAWGALAYAGSAGTGWGVRLLSWRPLVSLGIISYSVYLYNLAIRALPARLYPGITGHSLLWWVLGLVSLLTIGTGGYLVAERPFLSLRRRLRQVTA